MPRLFLALGLAAVITGCSSPASVSRQQTLSHCARPAEKGTWDPELSPLAPLASRIDQLGRSRYDSTYAGVQLLHQARELVVYVVPAHASMFLHATAAADTRRLCYTVKNVTRSYATQAAVSNWITAHAGLIREEGIALAFWGPWPSEDAVRVVIQTPASHALAQRGERC